MFFLHRERKGLRLTFLEAYEIKKALHNGKNLMNEYLDVMNSPLLDTVISDVDTRNIFRDTGSRRRVREMSAYITSGNKNLQFHILERSPIEVAAGLQYYLIRLPKELIPKYIQDLALDSDGHTEPEVVAADMLGLIQQDLKGRHRHLVSVLLDMLSYSRKHAFNDELAESNVPITLLPVFFNLQPNHLQKWRVIANIFMEMIDLSPTILPIPHRLLHSTSSSEHQREERNRQVEEHILREPQAIYEDEENVILHQVLIRSGSEGDANLVEIVDMNRLRPDIWPKMLNSAFGYYIRRFR